MDYVGMVRMSTLEDPLVLLYTLRTTAQIILNHPHQRGTGCASVSAIPIPTHTHTHLSCPTQDSNSTITDMVFLTT